MAKVLLHPIELDIPWVYIAHVGELSPDPKTSWHMIWDGTEEDIYWLWAFGAGSVLTSVAGEAYAYARDLAAMPQMARRICTGCWYQYYGMAFDMPIAPQWNIYHGEQKPVPPSIYWNHPYEWDNPPPGYWYPW